MLSVLALSARAEALAVVCLGFEVSDTVPGPGATEVPVDARPAVTFAEGCSFSSGWMAELRRAEDASLVLTDAASRDELAETTLLELFPTEPLDPETAYTLSLLSDVEEEVVVAFTTGTGTVAGLDTAPTVTTESASYVRRGAELTVNIQVTPAPDPDALSILQVKDADVDRGIQSFVVPATAQFERTLLWSDSVRPAEVCPQVRQLDGTGLATEWSEPACHAVSSCACSNGGPGAGLLAIGLALVGAARRRR